MKDDMIILKVPAKPDYVMIARLTCSSVATRVGFDIDEIEDIKMSIAEAMILILNQEVKPLEINIELEVKEKGMSMSILGEGQWLIDQDEKPDKEQKQLSQYILSSLVDEVDFIVDDGIIKRISMYIGCGGL